MALVLLPALSLSLSPAPVVIGGRRPGLSVCRASPVMESLASKMFGDVARGLQDVAKSLGQETPKEVEVDATAGADEVVADLDRRAQSGDITFDDFITMSRAFASMDSGSDFSAVLPGKLTAAELAETREKIVKHEKIVEVMLEEERKDPSLLVDDLKEGSSKPGPRLQRLAKASDLPETEVALFVMQFEAMRESTRRIAEGEDPDEVNQSMMAGPGSNRAARRAAKKKAAKKKKNKM